MTLSRPKIVSRDGVDELLGFIEDDVRDISIIVASPIPGVLPTRWAEAIDTLIRDAVGCASFFVLTDDAADEMNRLLGPAHAIPAGALRTFLPDIVIGDWADARRHRILTARTMSEGLSEKLRFSPRLVNAVASAPRGHLLDAQLPAELTRSARVLQREQLKTPVAQSVTTLPPPLADDTVERARAELAKARKVLAEAQSELLAAERGVSAHDARTMEASADLSATETRLAGLLEDRPAGDLRDLHGDRASLRSLREARAAAEDDLKVAAANTTSCDAALDAARATRTQAIDRLTSARTRLIHLIATLGSLSAPDLATDDDNLESSWAQFSSWAAGQRTLIATELQNATAAHDRTLGAAEDATTALEAAESAASTAQGESTATTSALAAARAEKTALNRQIHDLDEGLAEAPAEADLLDLLFTATRLEGALTEAQQALAPAQREAAAASGAVREALSAATDARGRLSGARDRLATLGPPTFGGEDLVADWKALTAWATDTETALQSQAADLQVTLGVAIDDQEQLSRTAHDLVETSGQDWDIASDAPPQTVLGEAIVRVERARGDLASITKALQQVAKLVAQLEQTQERQKVASQLATMMRSERFPRWLAQSALDSLVAGASHTLRDLSGEQFDLTHDKGDFYVIDHYDADSVRSVRTLSGGETFQASLALALTLSEQIAGMTGSVKLESIFLDEGFGTLDSDALETVAGTLENLAQGNRMVGVITHVGELAERAPVRFSVSNDTRTSSVVREGL